MNVVSLSTPIALRHMLVVYSIPILSITLDISAHPIKPLYFLCSLLFVPFCMLPIAQKNKLVILTGIHAISWLLNSRLIAYMVYGGVMTVCYNTSLQMCLSAGQIENVCMMFYSEMLGYLFGVFLPFRSALALLITAQLFLLLKAKKLPLEISSTERQKFLPTLYEKISGLYDSNYTLLSNEYKMVVEIVYKRKKCCRLFLFVWLCHMPMCYSTLGKVAMAVGPLMPVYKKNFVVFLYIFLWVMGIELGSITSWFVEWIDDGEGPYHSMTFCILARLVVSFVVYSFCFPMWIERMVSS
ncbi:hypothetical protein VCUG_02208 [Vavraia culicis subsp. floridensis]|uniref:Uncharacterized protein n=1 Tax=Vavraia culicis (isolate floridensis) TaxID=948595 RepID=L2GT88_VAVCU|nr:uncharacterized protein VCUG_02208 [Vavraia culicis subsp. floridensis]ELA46320.1 hypothetical protein VCUG_02208 [Vavraia culicis subsp. floridensis]